MGTNVGMLGRVKQFVIEDLWQMDVGRWSLTGAALGFLQFAVIVGQGFVRDHLLLRATALTYMTVLSLMPLLVVMVAFLGIVGDQRAVIEGLVGQLAAVSPELQALILERLSDIRLGSLGTIGASILLATAVLALRHLETTLNEIWGLRQSRTWMRRFADYLTVLVVAPILMATAISLATTLQSEPMLERLLQYPLFAQLYTVGLSQLPHLLLVIAFTFLYWFFPNTNVRPLSALLGGVLAMLLFSVARYVYVDLSLGSARYSMLFGGMVALPLVLVWLYVCWAIVLMGAEVAFAHQNLKHYRREARGLLQGAAEREATGLRLAAEIGRAFHAGEPPLDADELSDRLEASVRSLRELLDSFERAGLVVVCNRDEKQDGYVPARPLESISVSAILTAMRGPRTESDAGRGAEPAQAVGEGADATSSVEFGVADVLADLDRASAAVGDQLTLADIVTRSRAG